MSIEMQIMAMAMQDELEKIAGDPRGLLRLQAKILAGGKVVDRRALNYAGNMQSARNAAPVGSRPAGFDVKRVRDLKNEALAGAYRAGGDGAPRGSRAWRIKNNMSRAVRRDPLIHREKPVVGGSGPLSAEKRQGLHSDMRLRMKRPFNQASGGRVDPRQKWNPDGSAR